MESESRKIGRYEGNAPSGRLACPPKSATLTPLTQIAAMSG